MLVLSSSSSSSPLCRFLSLVLASLLVISSQLTASIAASSDDDLSKSITMVDVLAAVDTSNVLTLTDANYPLFVSTPEHQGKNRPYHLVILYTASQKRYKCQLCVVAETSFRYVAASYAAASSRATGIPLVFAIADYHKNQQAFKAHGFTQIPQLVLVPDTRRFNEDARADTDTFETRMMHAIYNSGESPEAMLRFVTSKTGFQFELERSMFIDIMTLMMMTLVVLIAVYEVLNNLEMCLLLLRTRILWLTMSFATFGFSICGMIYCLLRNPRPYGVEKGVIYYFSADQRDQYLYEGLIVGVLQAMMVGGLIRLNQWAKPLVGAQVTVEKKRWQSYQMLAAMVIIYAMHSQLRSIYYMKNKHYGQNMG